MLNLSIKLILLVVLLIGVEKQAIIAYYSLTPQQNIESIIDSLNPEDPVPAKTNDIIEIAVEKQNDVSSNVIFAWRVNNETRYRSFENKQLETLQRVSRTLPKDKFNDLMEFAKTMDSDTFIAYVKEQENILLTSTKIAKATNLN